jgi:transcriptional regulator with XRE-family HTH domain
MTATELNRLLIRLGLTHLQAAERLGVHRRTVDHWISGDRTIMPLTITALAALAREIEAERAHPPVIENRPALGAAPHQAGSGGVPPRPA